MFSIFSRKLRCPRNTLHMHLFLSFMCRAFMALLKDTLFIEGIGLSQTIVDGMSISEVSVIPKLICALPRDYFCFQYSCDCNTKSTKYYIFSIFVLHSVITMKCADFASLTIKSDSKSNICYYQKIADILT